MFSDKQPQKGLNYYRLRIVDVDGRYDFSEIKYVKNEDNVELVIFPSPVKDLITIQVDALLEEQAIILICDINGKILISQQVKMIAGTNSIQINSTSLLPGIYLIKINSSQSTAVKRFCKI